MVQTMGAVRNFAFSIAEYRQRVSKVQTALASRGLDALLLRDRADICYLTGLENCYMVAYYAAVVPGQGEPTLLASDFEMLNALATSWCEDRATFAVMADPLEATCRALQERG